MLGLITLFLAVESIWGQTCSKLLIDDYTVPKSNALGGYSGDDESMKSVVLAKNSLTLTGSTGGSSYFYESGFCQAKKANVIANGWKGLEFTVRPSVANFNFVIELQSRPELSCDVATYESSFIYTKDLGLTFPANRDTLLKIPFTAWASPLTLTNVVGVVIQTFDPMTSTVIFGPMSYYCADAPAPTQKDLIVDDFLDSQRLSFLGYNALLPPQASSHDGSMTSVTVSAQQLILVPKSNSYFYSNLGAINGISRGYQGIAFKLLMPVDSQLSLSKSFKNIHPIVLQTGAQDGSCTKTTDVTVDLVQSIKVQRGLRSLVKVPLSAFRGANLRSLCSILFSGFTAGKQYSIGVLRLYVKDSNFIDPLLPPAVSRPPIPNEPKPYKVSSAAPLVLESFKTTSTTKNDLGAFHGSDPGMTVKYSASSMTLSTTSSGTAWYSQFSNKACFNLSPHANGYLHLAVSSFPSTLNFSIAIQNQNNLCDASRLPSPGNWQEVDARRYLSGSHIYIPISHFPIPLDKALGIAIKSFTTSASLVLTRIEIVRSVPAGIVIPGREPQSPLVFSCKTPNTLAFGIDDGITELADKTLEILDTYGVKATFFVLGLPLEDPGTKMASIYQRAKSEGHQIAVHSYTHPYFSTLSPAELDYQLDRSLAVLESKLGVKTKYFRPPFGVINARARRHLADRGMTTVQWSIDVEDYIDQTNAEKQLSAFNRDLNKGGNLVVMHYMRQSTVDALPKFIESARSQGKKIVRLDQCLGDPAAPPII